METKRLHYGFAAVSFLVALITYTMTMQPTIPFWDCGEFAAAASTLSIPHPPGAPFWTIVGRLGMLIPTFADPVARYNFLSVLSSAASILLLYLTIVRLIRLWRGKPRSTADVVTHYGGALVGALAYCFTDSFWFNALECEVYAFGSLFISLIPWIALIWYEHAEEEHNERYLLLVFYVIGLSMGVHQLALLTMFPVFMLVYYKRTPKPTIGSFLAMVGASIIAFFIIFMVVLSKLVEWAGSGKAFIPIILLGGSIVGIYWSQKNKKPLLNISLWCSMLVFLGYTTYAVIMVRAAGDPPMNQWHASSFNVLTKYINREQYGEWKMFPRRLPEQQRDHQQTWTNYSSDGDFFWRYQTGHMFTRYLGWNFVGRANDNQDAGVDWSKTFGISLFLGLFGLFWHFRRDPKRALTLVAMFIFLGFLTAWYQNQQDPQPRERDYFYVGAFYVYAMWIGIGATGIMEIIRAATGRRVPAEELDARGLPVGVGPVEVMPDPDDSVPVFVEGGNVGVLGATLAGLIVISPINQAVGLGGMLMGQSFDQSSKWAEYSRYHNYIPYDEAYNMLQSCEPNAILFTAGDNDTFPLWCIQDVYGVRRDVRIVNLSLGNMSWYIKQLKNEEPWGSKKILLPGFTDELLNAPDDSQEGVHPIGGQATAVSLPVKGEVVSQITGEPGQQDAVMTWNYTGEFQQEGQQVYTVADQLIKEIVMNNINDRPIYFATVVPESYRIGIDPYLVSEGLAMRVTPIRHNFTRGNITQPINEKRYVEFAYTLHKEPIATPSRGMVLRTYNDPEARKSILDDHYALSYRLMYLTLADYYLNKQDLANAKRALDTMEARIPPTRVPVEGQFAQIISQFYGKVGDQKKAAYYIKNALNDLEGDLNSTNQESQTAAVRSRYSAAIALIGAGEYDTARSYLQQIKAVMQQNQQEELDIKIGQIDALKMERAGDKKKAHDMLAQLMQQHQAFFSQPGLPSEYTEIDQHRRDLAKQLGLPDTAAFAVKVPTQPDGTTAPNAPASPKPQPATPGKK